MQKKILTENYKNLKSKNIIFGWCFYFAGKQKIFYVSGKKSVL